MKTLVRWFLTLTAMGAFYALTGQAGNPILDNSFKLVKAADSSIFGAVLHGDKVWAWGTFTEINGIKINLVARLNLDGSVDTSFDPGEGPKNPNSFSCYVKALCPLPDGKILIGGAFSSVNSTTRNGLARLREDGSLDIDYKPGLVAPSIIDRMVPAPDNKYIMTGLFNFPDGTSSSTARINADGSRDKSFKPPIGDLANVTFQPDGKILACGNFQFTNSISPLARLLSDGSIDPSFKTPSDLTSLSQIIVLSDGRLLIIGTFKVVNGYTRYGIARLNQDGSFDKSFKADDETIVGSGTVQTDGKILLGGTYYGTEFITRLQADGSRDTSLPSTGWMGQSSGCGWLSGGRLIVVGSLTNQSIICMLNLNLWKAKRGASGQAGLFSFSGIGGVNYFVESSGDLRNWESVTNFIAGTNETTVAIPPLETSLFLRTKTSGD